MQKEKLPTYHYLQFIITGSNRKVKIADRNTGVISMVNVTKAITYHQNGQLYNKLYGNDFSVDLAFYIQAISYKEAIEKGFATKWKNELTYTAFKNRKRCDTDTLALRRFFPELL